MSNGPLTIPAGASAKFKGAIAAMDGTFSGEDLFKEGVLTEVDTMMLENALDMSGSESSNFSKQTCMHRELAFMLPIIIGRVCTCAFRTRTWNLN